MRPRYDATRFVLLRALAFVYLFAFFSIWRQLEPLLGEDGLLPARDFLRELASAEGSAFAGFLRYPSLFWITGASDGTMNAFCVLGILLSLAALFGVTNAFVQLGLWALYMSIVHVGQAFYSYGWEMQLLETGFLAIFLCPLTSWRPFPATEPPTVVIWLFRWLIARVMLGAALIKLRGDACWTDLTCLVYHYETQPIPSPLSWAFHQLPVWAHKLGALFNYLVELVAPFFLVAPRGYRHAAGALFIAFQVVLILSGNLAFLNWLTIVPAIACFDDGVTARLLPARMRAVLTSRAGAPPTRAHRITSYVLAAIVGVLSVAPTLNLFSSHQVMNTSFEPFDLVNTYGAFGSVGRERNEVILEGTSDLSVNDKTTWREYEFPCKPGDVTRRPCFITPYHYRLDWQIWFAAMSSYDDEPWLVHLVSKLLRGDPTVKRLLARDPFPDAPPQWIRAELYRYSMTRLGADSWWTRTRVGEWMRPVREGDPDLSEFLRAHGWH